MTRLSILPIIYDRLAQFPRWIEKRLEWKTNPAGRQATKLQLGEAYYRNDKNLTKARKTFAEVAGSADASPAIREEAQLWCEMLAD